MSMHIRLPNITGKTAEEQAQQMKSYLTQLAGELNWALGNLQSAESAGYEPYRSSNQGASADNPQQKAEDVLKNFNDIKGLIIKSADIVNAYYEEINTRLEGLYVAQSEYGTFVEQTTAIITENSQNTTTNYTNIQLLTGRTDKAEEEIETNRQTIQSTREDLEGIIDQTEKALQESISTTDEKLTKAIDDTAKSLNSTITNTDTALRGVIDQTEQSLQKAIDDQDTELRKVISQVDTDLQQVVTATEARLAGAVNETQAGLEQAIAAAKDDMINNLGDAEQNMANNISSVESALNKSISDTRTALEDSISDTETNLTNSINGTKDVLDGNIESTKDTLDQSIKDAKDDLQKDINTAKSDLSDSISDAESSLNKSINDTKDALLKDIADAEERLKDLIDSSNAILIEVQAHTRSGLLYYDDSGIPIYGFEVGQRNLVNGQEVFNQYARFTANKLSFYDNNGDEVAYISDKKLFIKNAEIRESLKQGGFEDTVMADKSIVTKWIGGG